MVAIAAVVSIVVKGKIDQATKKQEVRVAMVEVPAETVGNEEMAGQSNRIDIGDEK